MLRALAFSATSSPTSLAAATFPPDLSLAWNSGDRLPTAASVRPASSSMSWAKMCFRLLNTERRGRAAVPRTRCRTRRCRIFRPSTFTLVSTRRLYFFVVVVAAPAFLPTFRRMTSSTYFTPLPL